MKNTQEDEMKNAQEVEDGQRWAISRIKQLTGGDTVPARFMRQDYFKYTPHTPQILAGNEKPDAAGD